MSRVVMRQLTLSLLPSPHVEFFVSLWQIKPDGVQRGLVGQIINRFETKGYKLAAMKTKQASKELLEQHYKDLVEKPFFPKLRDYMLSGPVVCMVSLSALAWRPP